MIMNRESKISKRGATRHNGPRLKNFSNQISLSIHSYWNIFSFYCIVYCVHCRYRLSKDILGEKPSPLALMKYSIFISKICRESPDVVYALELSLLIRNSQNEEEDPIYNASCGLKYNLLQASAARYSLQKTNNSIFLRSAIISLTSPVCSGAFDVGLLNGLN